MTWLRDRLRSLMENDDGVTVIEFALISGPMTLLLLGGLELGYDSYVRSTMQGALNDAARTATVESPVINFDGDTLEERVEALIKAQVRHVAPNAEVNVTQKSYFDFSDIGNPEKLMTDKNGNGRYDPADGDCFEDANGNGVYDTDAGRENHGGADDVVLYTSEVTAPRLLPLDGFLPGVGPTIEFTIETAVKNQPYGKQATPAVICG